MKNKNQHLLKEFLSSLLILIFTFICLLGSVFAWFTLQENVEINAFQATVRSKYITSVNISTYAISGITTGPPKMYTLASSNDHPIPLQDLPMYDNEGIVLNEYKTYLAANLTFTVTEDNIDLKIVAHTENDIVYNSDNWLSNCIQIVSVEYNGSFDLSSQGMTNSFVTVGETELSKTNTIELQLLNGLKVGAVSIWFVFEYNRPAIEVIHEKNILSKTELINYKNDIRLELRDL